jgi:hypothetical protein
VGFFLWVCFGFSSCTVLFLFFLFNKTPHYLYIKIIIINKYSTCILLTGETSGHSYHPNLT